MDQKKFNISTWKESQGPYILKAQQRAMVFFFFTKAFVESIWWEEDHNGSLFGDSEWCGEGQSFLMAWKFQKT